MQRILVCLCVLLLMGCASEPLAPVPALRVLAENANRAAISAARSMHWESAAVSWREALTAYQAIDDWEGQGRARLGLADVLARLGRKTEAENNLFYMTGQGAFSRLLRARAHYQLALLAAEKDREQAGRWLAEARQLCAPDCAHVSSFDNLEARLSAARADWGMVERLTTGVLARHEVVAAERSHALRLLAETQFERGELVTARASIIQALTLDRELAEPEWLLEDYTLLGRIAAAIGDGVEQKDAAARIASLCRGAKLAGCGR